MKVTVGVWRVTWRYLILAAVIVIALFGFGFSIFTQIDSNTGIISFAPWGVSQILAVSITGSILIIGYFLSIFAYYYIIEDDYFIMKRFGKEFVFEYKSIEFIDFEESKRKKQVIFYTQKARTRYLLGDKKGMLLETLKKKCPNVMSVSEFKAAHPEERY